MEEKREKKERRRRECTVRHVRAMTTAGEAAACVGVCVCVVQLFAGGGGWCFGVARCLVLGVWGEKQPKRWLLGSVVVLFWQQQCGVFFFFGWALLGKRHSVANCTCQH